ncbi:MAG: VOC family protein [Deltaproteobacteria bacterium]|nr:VOC family protein [Nannocystaceae bacterium]
MTTALHPRLVIADVDRAIAFYRAAFGCELLERFVTADGVVVHAAMRLGTSTFSMAEQVQSWQLLAPPELGGSAVLLHLTVDDPDTVCARVVELGGTVVIPIEDRNYGKREGRVRDPFGHLWILSHTLEQLTDEEIQRRLGAS